jgi:hypothetical protein
MPAKYQCQLGLAASLNDFNDRENQFGAQERIVPAKP